ncbi:MAG: hypothetical protein DLM67_25250 [Candidatus Nephthysia bennettiae]|nr:MAG: hypothetical protein DLM67_25250 [Candidatus Dormibacteraeota bacterium]
MLLTLIGLLLLLVGVAIIVVGLGGLGLSLAHGSAIPTAVAEHVKAPTGYDLLGLAIAGALALLLGLPLLGAELQVRPRPRMGNLHYQPGGDQVAQRGRTVVRSGGLEHGVQQSLQTLPGVNSAQVQLGGDSEHPNLVIELEVDAQTRLSTLKSEVRRGIERFRRTAGRQPSAQIRIHLASSRRSVS